MNTAYMIYQAERTRTAAEQREVDCEHDKVRDMLDTVEAAAARRYARRRLRAGDHDVTGVPSRRSPLACGQVRR